MIGELACGGGEGWLCWVMGEPKGLGVLGGDDPKKGLVLP